MYLLTWRKENIPGVRTVGEQHEKNLHDERRVEKNRKGFGGGTVALLPTNRTHVTGYVDLNFKRPFSTLLPTVIFPLKHENWVQVEAMFL